MQQSESLKKIEEIIKDVKFAMLTTRSKDGKLFSRPMAMLPDFNLSEGIFFFSRDDSPKVVEITDDEQVNLAFASPEKQSYVSFSGKATVSQDWAKMAVLWNPLFKAWFPEGLDDPHLCLIRVRPEEAEFWDSPSSPVVKVLNLLKVISGQDIEPGENEKLNI